MPDMRDPLIRSSHRRVASIDPSVESQEVLGQALPVTWLGHTLIANDHSNGGVTLAFKDQAAAGNILTRLWSLCGIGPDPQVKISGDELIGARVVDGAFQLWYCTQGGSSSKPTRILHTTAHYKCDTVDTAEQVAHNVRRRSSWSASTSAPRIVVIINPHSGTGRAGHVWQKTAEPIFAAAGIQVEVHKTTHAGHATALVQQLQLQGLRAIVLVGGDGTVWEALQGLMTRSDWQEARKTPLAQIPAGSGNALSANSNVWTPVTAAWAICKGRTSPFDIFSVIQPPAKRAFGFLSVSYGMITNLDNGTEHLRWLGTLRFTYGALKQILLAHSWRLRLAYYREDAAIPPVSGLETDGPATPMLDTLTFNSRDPFPSSANLPQGWTSIPEETIQMCTACNLPYLDLDAHFAPDAGFSSGAMDLVYTSDMQRSKGLQILLKSSSGQHLQVEGVRHLKVKAFVLEPIDDGTWLAVDGEAIPRERVFIEVHPGLCRVITA